MFDMLDRISCAVVYLKCRHFELRRNSNIEDLLREWRLILLVFIKVDRLNLDLTSDVLFELLELGLLVRIFSC